MNNVTHGSNDSNWGGNRVNIVMPENRRLPKTEIAKMGRGKAISQGRKIFGVKNSVNIATS